MPCSMRATAKRAKSIATTIREFCARITMSAGQSLPDPALSQHRSKLSVRHRFMGIAKRWNKYA
jgi:hypothetical protein